MEFNTSICSFFTSLIELSSNDIETFLFVTLMTRLSEPARFVGAFSLHKTTSPTTRWLDLGAEGAVARGAAASVAEVGGAGADAALGTAGAVADGGVARAAEALGAAAAVAEVGAAGAAESLGAAAAAGVS